MNDSAGAPPPHAGDDAQHPPHAEVESWADWIGSRQCDAADEATRAMIQAAFAAGFQAGWRKRGHADS